MARVVEMFPKARRSLSAVTVAYSELGNALCFVLACPTRPSCSRERIQELAIDFAIKTNNLREQPTGVIARWKAGARSWTQTWTLPPDQWPTSFYCFICSEIKLCTVWILFRSVQGAKVEASEANISKLKPQLETRVYRTEFLDLLMQQDDILHVA